MRPPPQQILQITRELLGKFIFTRSLDLGQCDPTVGETHMKKQLSRSILVASSLMLTSLSGPLLADAAGDISVSDAYVRATAPGQANSAAYLKLHNGSMAGLFRGWS